MGHVLAIHEHHKELYWCSGTYVYAGVQLPLGATVLEIGAGSDPHPATEFVLDKYIEDNGERGGQNPLAREKILEKMGGVKMVVPLKITAGDAIDMPYPDKSFDFIIAKDVLEHVPDVERAFAELSRVGRAGMIDVPTMASEVLWPQGAMHRWVFSAGPTAHRIRFESPWGRLMHDGVAQSAAMESAWSQSRHHFHLVHLWEGCVKVAIGPDAVMDGAYAFKDMRGLNGNGKENGS